MANGPETERRTTDGRTHLRFGRTEPLPTYLVAFAAVTGLLAVAFDRAEALADCYWFLVVGMLVVLLSQWLLLAFGGWARRQLCQDGR